MLILSGEVLRLEDRENLTSRPSAEIHEGN